MHRRTSLWLLLLLLLLGCSTPAPESAVTATVARALSGQTLEAILDTEPNAEPLRVRLNGINAPSREQQPWGERARSRLAELAGDRIRLELIEATDRYERRFGYIWQGETLVNEQLLAEGLVFSGGNFDPSDRYQQRLIHAREYARITGLGIWNPEAPLRQPPQIFRARSPS